VTLVLPTAAVPLSSEPELEILARTWRGLKALSAPAMGALARAMSQRHRLHRQRAARARHRREHGRRGRARPRFAARALADLAASASQQPREHPLSLRRLERVSTGCGSTGSSSTAARTSRTDDTTLDAAQAGKVDHICRKLRLQPGDRFLDIGCGWGALLFHAAERYGVEASGITLSKNQFEHVKAEIAARGLTAASRSSCGTTRPARGRAVRQDRERRDVRARRDQALSRSTSARSCGS
jgi:hypothetical protein